MHCTVYTVFFFKKQVINAKEMIFVLSHYYDEIDFEKKIVNRKKPKLDKRNNKIARDATFQPTKQKMFEFSNQELNNNLFCVRIDIFFSLATCVSTTNLTNVGILLLTLRPTFPFLFRCIDLNVNIFIWNMCLYRCAVCPNTCMTLYRNEHTIYSCWLNVVSYIE